MDVAGAERRTVLLAISGDEAAFAALVRSHQGYVGALLRRASGNAALAEDLAQSTFLRAWRQLHTLKNPDAFRSWLRRIALNLLIDAVRRGAVPDAEPEWDAVATQPSPETAIACAMDLDAALGRLAPAQRTCIILAYGEGMSHSEIAVALDLPFGTVKSHIARGVSTLRACLADWSGR
ncbi:MAG: sigma-70 family RNA polymerase sigma factor [Erythrobacter sp.]|jgi:RNA polymerase sigma-70 factor (ECF subfamily)